MLGADIGNSQDFKKPPEPQSYPPQPLGVDLEISRARFESARCQMRDAPTLSREGRTLVGHWYCRPLRHRSSAWRSFDITTAFLRGKADKNNPLAMEPPPELRRTLKMSDNEACQLLGNAYGRVDAPLLFYKEFSRQLLELGFQRHPLEPCVFMLYTGQRLHGLLSTCG